MQAEENGMLRYVHLQPTVILRFDCWLTCRLCLSLSVPNYASELSQRERGHGGNFLLTSDESVIAVQELSNSHLEFRHRDVADGIPRLCRSRGHEFTS